VPIVHSWTTLRLSPVRRHSLLKLTCKRCTQLAVLILCFFGAAFGGSDERNLVLTGTVNIVLANGNGIVVLTDSNQTGWQGHSGEPFTYPRPGQKLFVLDDYTVCTIAGFGSKAFPGYPELTSSAAALLDRYSRELRNNKQIHSFREKLTSLEYLFGMLLSTVGNLPRSDGEKDEDYDFQLILAGYDTNGTGKLGKIVMGGTRPSGGTFRPVTKQLSEIPVPRELVYETAGMGGAAENILEHPEQLSEEPEIGRYLTSKPNHGSSLTISDMEALAKSLARHTAMVNRHYIGNFGRVWWPVGGSDQIAILERGSIQKIDQPTALFEERRLNMPPFSLVMKLTAPIGVDTSRSNSLFLYLNSVFLGGIVHLDGAYFFEDDFSNVTFYYDGGVLGFDPSNGVTDCVLTLGPHADRKSPAVQDLIARFPWKNVRRVNYAGSASDSSSN
jgi:hypothetical protein